MWNCILCTVYDCINLENSENASTLSILLENVVCRRFFKWSVDSVRSAVFKMQLLQETGNAKQPKISYK